MGFSSRLLGLVARIGLDLLIGTKRTDEAVALVSEWFGERSAEEQETEVAEARTEAANLEGLREALTVSATEAGTSLDPTQLDGFLLSVSAGLESLEAGPNLDPAQLVEQLAARRGTYAVWLDLEAVCQGQPGRYCHFNWDGDSYRIRDYLGGRIFHPPGRRASDTNLLAVELPMTALEVWQVSQGPVPCLSRYGLAFPVGEHARWTQMLRLMTEVAREWQEV